MVHHRCPVGSPPDLGEKHRTLEAGTDLFRGRSTAPAPAPPGRGSVARWARTLRGPWSLVCLARPELLHMSYADERGLLERKESPGWRSADASSSPGERKSPNGPSLLPPQVSPTRTKVDPENSRAPEPLGDRGSGSFPSFPPGFRTFRLDPDALGTWVGRDGGVFGVVVGGTTGARVPSRVRSDRNLRRYDGVGVGSDS